MNTPNYATHDPRCTCPLSAVFNAAHVEGCPLRTATPRNRVRDGLIAGFLLCSALRSLYEDWIGQTGMEQAIREHWVTGWITVPLALLWLLTAASLYAGRPRS